MEPKADTAPDWGATLDRAKTLAKNGNAKQGLEALFQAISSTPSDPALAQLCEFATLNGFYNEVCELAKNYVTEGAARSYRHQLCNVYVFDVLRKCGEYDTMFQLLEAIPQERPCPPQMYHKLADAVHDEILIESELENPKLLILLKASIEQKHQRGSHERSIFLHKHSQLAILAPKTFHKLKGILNVLIKQISDQLDDSRYSWVARFMLNTGSMTQSDVVRAFNALTSADITAVLASGGSNLHRLIQLLYADDGFKSCAYNMEPHVILVFDKFSSSDIDSFFAFVVSHWLEALPERCKDVDPSELNTQVLDQLVLKYRASHPNVYKWYTAKRSDVQQLSELNLIKDLAIGKPFIATDRKPKIAVCISGQLRGYTQAFPEVRQHFLDDVDSVIFVDTWKKIGRKTPTPAQAWRIFSGEFLAKYQAIANTLGYPALQSKYPNLTRLDDASSVTVEDLAAFYGCSEENVRVEDDEQEPFKEFTNPKKMYHKIFGCHELMKKSGEDFDAILRIRPDKGINGRTPHFDWIRMINESRLEKAFFADFPMRIHISSGLVMGDQAGVATPEIMDIYANAENDTLAAGKLDWLDWTSTTRAHGNLSHALWINQVRVDTLPVRWGAMYDPEKLSPVDILALLEKDCANRSADAHDQALLDAARKDAAAMKS